MATYITLMKFTDQGIRNIKESPDRLAAFKAMAEKLGLAIKSVHYTVGDYDIVTVAEGSEDACMSAALKLNSLGNVRTLTMRAFTPEEMKTIINKTP